MEIRHVVGVQTSWEKKAGEAVQQWVHSKHWWVLVQENTESFRLGITLKVIEPNHKPGTAKSTMSLRATNTLILNTSRNDGSTTSLSSLFQTVTLSVKIFS